MIGCVTLGTNDLARAAAFCGRCFAEIGAKRLRYSGRCNEGPVGPRGAGFYTGHFRCLDGNRLNVFCRG